MEKRDVPLKRVAKEGDQAVFNGNRCPKCGAFLDEDLVCGNCHIDYDQKSDDKK